MSVKVGNDTLAFFPLLRAGLWEQDVNLSEYGPIYFNEIYRIASEQSVVGLVAAGIEHVLDVKAPKDLVLTMVGETLQLEQRNVAMNAYIAGLTEKLKREGIYSVLIKGQGIAQCYERPLWRTSGDIDLFLDAENYVKAKELLLPFGQVSEPENRDILHFGINVDEWVLELHGTLHTLLWKGLDKEIDTVQLNTFGNCSVRTWKNGDTEVQLPAVDDDVVYVFTHILAHFFEGGIGLRQVCDWCRLLFTYKSEIDFQLLESRLLKMGLISEWRAFAYLAVNALGMPADAMPLYSPAKKWVGKSDRILALILESGNFGHNRDNSYYQKYPYLVYKAISLWRNTWDSMRHFMIFPIDATKVWWNRLWIGIKTVAKGK